VNTVAIMQPAYLPWMGYLDMVDQADLFILLDTVAIDRKSWQTRNRILGRDNSVVWLSVPINAHRGDLICNTKIAAGSWPEKHCRTLKSAYGDLPFWESLWDVQYEIRHGYTYLAKLSRRLMLGICDVLGIDTPIRAAGMYELPPTDDAVQRIQDLCEKVGADEILDTAGARDVLGLDQLPNGTPIRYHQYQPQPYPQNGSPFISHLSVVDALARLGPESTLDLVRSGRLSPSEA
jgi:hypothetical protein